MGIDLRLSSTSTETHLSRAQLQIISTSPAPCSSTPHSRLYAPPKQCVTQHLTMPQHQLLQRSSAAPPSASSSGRTTLQRRAALHTTPCCASARRAPHRLSSGSAIHRRPAVQCFAAQKQKEEEDTKSGWRLWPGKQKQGSEVSTTTSSKPGEVSSSCCCTQNNCNLKRNGEPTHHSTFIPETARTGPPSAQRLITSRGPSPGAPAPSPAPWRRGWPPFWGPPSWRRR
jgi:hypothetical protein